MSIGVVAAHATRGDYPAVILALSPVGYWRLDETSGTVAEDVTANNRDCAYVGAPTLGAAPLLPVSGGTAVTLDGTNDHLTLAHDAAFNANYTTGFAVTMWVKVNDPSADKLQVIIDKTGVSAANGQWSAWWDNRSSQGSPQRLRFLIGTNSVSADWSGTAAAAALAAGGFLTLRSSSIYGATTLYWNGVQVGTATTTPTLTSGNTRTVYVGSLSGTSAYLDGVVDEIAIFASALTQAQIQALHAAA